MKNPSKIIDLSLIWPVLDGSIIQINGQMNYVVVIGDFNIISIGVYKYKS